jgi:hypothetical protein
MKTGIVLFLAVVATPLAFAQSMQPWLEAYPTPLEKFLQADTSGDEKLTHDETPRLKLLHNTAWIFKSTIKGNL